MPFYFILHLSDSWTVNFINHFY